jgi:NAD(P)-dependent dehydrogenase (short-subunit alcohol dehydrogenase family)
MPSERLRGLCALVTGGGTGIGRGIAEELLRAGCAVAIGGRRVEALERAARELRASHGGSVVVAPGDVSSAPGAAAVVAAAASGLGALHIVVNNAGVGHQGPFDQISPEQVREVVGVDLEGPIFVVQAALPHLRRHGEARTAAVLNVSSSVTLMAIKNYAVYSAAKAGLDMLTRCLALELAGDRVRVNAVCPGVVETEIFERMLGAARARQHLDTVRGFVPLGRIGKPADVARVAVALCDPENDWVTGAVVPVDGGLSLGPG